MLFFEYVASVLLPEHNVRVADAGVTDFSKRRTGVAAGGLSLALGEFRNATRSTQVATVVLENAVHVDAGLEHGECILGLRRQEQNLLNVRSQARQVDDLLGSRDVSHRPPSRSGVAYDLQDLPPVLRNQ